jgi:hypothetical protein
MYKGAKDKTWLKHFAKPKGSTDHLRRYRLKKLPRMKSTNVGSVIVRHTSSVRTSDTVKGE